MSYTSTELMQLAIERLGLDIDRSGYTKCPVCDQGRSKKRLNINLGKGVFRCAKCGTSGNGVMLYAWFTRGIEPSTLKGQNNPASKEAYKMLLNDSGISAYQPRHIFKPVEQQKENPVASLAERNATYSAMLANLELSKEHYNSLIRRGLRKTDIIKNGYKSVPDKSVLTQIPNMLRSQGACTLTGIPGFLRVKDTGKWEIKQTASGIYIPVRNVPEDFRDPYGMIEGFQIRFDDLEKTHGQRYLWLSSRNYESYANGKYDYGCGAATWAHFVGYPEREVFITEGPLKSDVISRFLDAPVVGIPGVNSLTNLVPMLDKLSDLGVRKYNIAFDMDLYDKPEVKKALEKLTELLKEKKLEYENFVWDKAYKGLDDYLLATYQKNGGLLDPFI